MPGKIELNKLNHTQTYPDITNYWAPLDKMDNHPNKPQTKTINSIKYITKAETKKMDKWTRRLEKQQEQRIIINSGATSHFMCNDLNLPNKGPLNKEVYLPNNMVLKTSFRTELPLN
jgi:hypothetical protein